VVTEENDAVHGQDGPDGELDLALLQPGTSLRCGDRAKPLFRRHEELLAGGQALCRDLPRVARACHGTGWQQPTGESARVLAGSMSRMGFEKLGKPKKSPASRR